MTKWIAMAPLTAGLLCAQEGAPKPSFEVASVKLDTNCGGRGRGMSGMPSPGRLNLQCSTVENLIQAAYVVFAHGSTPTMKNVEITGGPSWVRSDMYSINAKTEGAAQLTEMYGPLLRALLEERFQLKIHTETKEAPVYFLTQAKGGSKLKPTAEGSCTPLDLNNLPKDIMQGKPPAIKFCGNQSMRGNGKTMTMNATGILLSELTGGMMSNMLDRPVIDKTGLTGRFDIELEFAPENGMPMFQGRGGIAGGGDAGSMPLSSDPVGPTIFTALEKAGLRLEQGKGPVEVYVIDHIERPADN